MPDLNKPLEGDLAKYNGIIWVYSQGKWLVLEEAMKIVFEVGV
jgi:hypothetical protein